MDFAAPAKGECLGLLLVVKPNVASGKKRFLVILWILIPAVFNCLLLGLCVNTLWVAQLYGSKTYWGWFAYRLAEYAGMVPVNVLLAAAILPVVSVLRKQIKRKRAG